jgi:serine protease Do
MTRDPVPRIRCLALVAAVAWAAPRVLADEPAGRLTPVPAASAPQERVDPVRPTRPTVADRDRLYEQVAREAEHLEQQARQFRRLVELVRPTVVHIDARKPLQRPRNGKATEEESGSGVIARVAGKTVVLTNRHVIHRAELDAITVQLVDARVLRPRRLWSDAGTDIAVLEVEGDDLPEARLAAGDPVQIGDTVLVIGSPFGLRNSVTLGIVSAKGRRDLELGEGTVRFQDFIQTDAAVNPGNSGGPLVNVRGEVVGIITAIASGSGLNEGIGFAIPMPMVLFVAGQLVENGSVARGFLGVTLDDEFSLEAANRLGMARLIGARVEAVTPGAPAATAGIRIDDVIVEYAGTPVDDDDHLMSLVSTTPAESTVDVVLFRDRKRVGLRLRVASRNAFE